MYWDLKIFLAPCEHNDVYFELFYFKNLLKPKE